MYHVYILKSRLDEDKTYIGITQCLERRINEHNAGKVKYTSKYLPWSFETVISFRSKNLAMRFEKYLKRGSGHAFMKKRLI